MEVEVGRPAGIRGQAAEGVGDRERPVEEASGRDDVGQCDPPGRELKKVVTPAAKRAAVAHVRAEHDVSERRACRVLDVDRSMVRYRSIRPDDAAIRTRLRELANERRRFGFRRLGFLLEREGVQMYHKKLLRLYREEGLAVRRRRGRKRALGTRAPMELPNGPGQRARGHSGWQCLFRLPWRRRCCARRCGRCRVGLVHPSRLLYAHQLAPRPVL